MKKRWKHIKILLLKAHWEDETTRTIKLLTGFNMATNARMAKSLGLAPNFRKIWSKRMDLVLIDHYKTHTNMELAEMVKKIPWIHKANSITPKAIAQRLKFLGCHRTEKELSKIKQKNSIRLLQSGVIEMPRTNELAKGTFRFRGDKLWYKSEDGKWVIYKNYLYELHFGKIPPGKKVRVIDNNEGNVVIENLILFDVYEGAHNAAKELTDNIIIGYLRLKDPELYDAASIERIKTTNREIIEIKKMEIKLKRSLKGLSGRAPVNAWSKKDEDFLRENYGIEPMYYIYKSLGVTYHVAKYKADCLGLKGKTISMWGKKAIDIVKENMENYNNKEIAKMLNDLPNYSKRKFTPVAIKEYMEKNGLRRSPEAVMRMLHKKRKP